MKRLSVLVVSVVVLSGCPETGVVCRAGTSRCGNGCSDYSSDSKNCGACGTACFGSQVCSNGACLCRAGTQLCDGQCVVIENDPRHCGACGVDCSSRTDGGASVCEDKTCKSGCSLGATQCSNGACTSLQTDPLNCGACGNACPDSQSCKNGTCTWDLVAACLSTGQVVGLQSGSEVRGPLKDLGTAPISLQKYGPVVLAADTLDARLNQASFPSLNALSEFNSTGRGLNQVVVDGTTVYAINSTGHTVQVLAPIGDAGCPAVVQPDAGCAYVGLDDGGASLPLQGDGGCFLPVANDGGCGEALQEDGGLGPFVLEDAGCFVVPQPPPAPMMPCFEGAADGGLKLATVGQVDTGLNSFPQAAVKVGNVLWVPLYGGFGSQFAAGQKVVKVDVTNPSAPAVTATVSLSGVDLKPFDGGPDGIARPYAVVESGGKIYVALNNFDSNYVPYGPGLVAVIDATTSAVTSIDLGADCLNPVALTVSGGRFYVSCGGAATFDSNYKLVANRGYGVVAMNADGTGRTLWSPACPSGGDGGCMPIQPSRLAVRDGRLYVGDQNGGRIFVADIAGNTLTERRGYAAGAMSGPVQACGVDPVVGFSNVADILVVP